MLYSTKKDEIYLEKVRSIEGHGSSRRLESQPFGPLCISIAVCSMCVQLARGDRPSVQSIELKWFRDPQVPQGRRDRGRRNWAPGQFWA